MLPMIVLFLFPFQRDPVRPLDEIRLKQGAELERFDRDRKQIMRLQRREFEERLNALSSAIDHFSREYNETKGDVWPKKKAEAIAEAIKRLEGTYVWKKGIEKSKDRSE